MAFGWFRSKRPTPGPTAREAAFDEIYAANGDAILRYLRRLTGSPHAAEELLQETFLKLHERPAGFEVLSNPRAWLFRVATNLASDRARNAQRAAEREQRWVQGRGAPVVRFDRRLEQQEAILRALTEIPPRMRQVLLLSAEGWTYREIASIAGIEAGYVGVLLQRGRAAFARAYEAEERAEEKEEKKDEQRGRRGNR
ncbi:MAG: RNA polymerase sigma factor [Vicinamibacterales bacterium]